MTVLNPAGSPVEQEWNTLLIELGLGSGADRDFPALSRAAEIELIIEDLDRPLALAGAMVSTCACMQDSGRVPRME